MIMTVRGRYALLASAALFCFASGTATAQAPTTKAAPLKASSNEARPTPAPQAAPIPWLVNCASLTGKTTCEAVQSLMIEKTGQLLLSVSVRVPPGSKTGALMLHLPHGMFLPDGIVLAIDGAAGQKQPVQMCDQKGCYVGMLIDDALLKRLQTGKTLSISFKSLDKKDIMIPISLGGFKEAYSKLL